MNKQEYQKQYMKQWRVKNADRIVTYRRKYSEENKEKIKQSRLLRKDANKEYEKKYRLEHKDRINAYKRELYKKTYKTNVCRRVTQALRHRLYMAIRFYGKRGSAIKDLGCSVATLKEYLESKFTNGMTWDNYGLNGWEIDHILPLSSFNLSDRQQFLRACHYTNLQPMWFSENRSKNNKIISSLLKLT